MEGRQPKSPINANAKIVYAICKVLSVEYLAVRTNIKNNKNIHSVMKKLEIEEFFCVFAIPNAKKE